jgi:hypothetical protein
LGESMIFPRESLYSLSESERVSQRANHRKEREVHVLADDFPAGKPPRDGTPQQPKTITSNDFPEKERGKIVDERKETVVKNCYSFAKNSMNEFKLKSGGNYQYLICNEIFLKEKSPDFQICCFS